MPGVDLLYEALAEVLAVCVTALEDTPDGPPDCRYLAPGPPPWDSMPCLIVYAGGPQVAETLPLAPVLSPGHRVAVMAEVDLVSITATILRCAPALDDAGQMPPLSVFDATTRQTSADLWAVWAHLKQAKRDETLFSPKEREFFLDPAVAVNQEGGACGWQVTLRTQIDGYRPA